MTRRVALPWLCAALVVWCEGCGTVPPKPGELATNREADDAGRFLAGFEGREGSPYRSWQVDIAWTEHVRVFDLQWLKLERDRLPAMREFQQRELSEAGLRNAAVFYPFGGPDILTATILFPDSPLYVLVGLEPPGSVTSSAALARRSLAVHLPRYRRALESVLHRTFFITGEMDQQLRGQVADGLLPVFLIQLVRTRHTVLSAKAVTLDPAGRVVEAAGAATGAAIEFQREGSRRVQMLLYLSANLATERLKRNEPLIRFLESRPAVATFFKATSYMPHRANFSLLRTEVLKKSAVVVQDDSGIPYKYYEPKRWRVELYGDYERPYGSFRGFQQVDLQAAYRSGRAKKLGFGIGYGFGRIPSNLQVAYRR